MSSSQKFENPEVEKHILELLNTGQFASTWWVAEQLGCCWSTARIVLLDMTRQNKLQMIHTSIGYVFAVPESASPEPKMSSAKSKKEA